MKIFLDTSALAKRYVQEPGSKELEEFFDSATPEVVVSTLAFVEFSAAMGRKLRNKEVARMNASLAIKELEEDWYNVFAKIPLDESLAETAAAIALEYSLRDAEAVHLASAQVTGAELFVASDDQLIRVAKKMGIESYNPESYPYK